jgi:radical SAM superfamily enzyme YgiQ (UPF0313 family)
VHQGGLVKFALVSFGNEESYGLLFAGTEFKKHGEIRFFDAEFGDIVSSVVAYAPDYLCFSPMTCFFSQAKKIEKAVREKLPNVVSVYGGHHTSNSGKDCGDITVVGAVHNLDLSRRGIFNGGATHPENLVVPAREEYYRDIPRMKTRYRKIMLSVVGCPWSCSYCSSALGNFKRMYGEASLKHRKIDDIINEAKYIKDTTQEIEWVDDDILMGDYEWYTEFFTRWQEEIGLPMYVSTTSINALKAPAELLILMRKSVNCIGMGVQAIRPESLKLLGRAWDNEAQLKKAYDRLTAFGFRVNLQAIVGLPLHDPIEDALDTVDGLIRIGKGCIASVYPLQIYPNTRIEKYCLENNFFLNDEVEGDTNSGMCGINFGMKNNHRLRNICKLATMAVKFGIERKWIEVLLEADISDASEKLSMVRYFECVKDRLPNQADKIFNSITATMHLRH